MTFFDYKKNAQKGGKQNKEYSIYSNTFTGNGGTEKW
ncbi:hypothetical protein NIES37_62670 [Tolypothrix tenuis PCC 7101]|uniref:Uncharacterized protein n=1 Tax=Tolypothrix tenuis PCC 7101 TaxID=231146 RepID=A0A1Z4N987_9CYAN|nr:hypothetical protein NIES37_62670 [Tolypothrix tenuis PCC 7101]BAZ73824.1 hypothetical protein NIES50_23900 [Aulosira laxa NIES-50]